MGEQNKMNWVRIFESLKENNPLEYYRLLSELNIKEKVVATTQTTISKGHTSDSHAIKEGDM